MRVVEEQTKAAQSDVSDSEESQELSPVGGWHEEDMLAYIKLVCSDSATAPLPHSRLAAGSMETGAPLTLPHLGTRSQSPWKRPLSDQEDDSSDEAETGSLLSREHKLSNMMSKAFAGSIFDRLGEKPKPRNASATSVRQNSSIQKHKNSEDTGKVYKNASKNKQNRSPIRFVVTGVKRQHKSSLLDIRPDSKKPRRIEYIESSQSPEFSPDSSSIRQRRLLVGHSVTGSHGRDNGPTFWDRALSKKPTVFSMIQGCNKTSTNPSSGAASHTPALASQRSNTRSRSQIPVWNYISPASTKALPASANTCRPQTKVTYSKAVALREEFTKKAVRKAKLLASTDMFQLKESDLNQVTVVCDSDETQGLETANREGAKHKPFSTQQELIEHVRMKLSLLCIIIMYDCVPIQALERNRFKVTNLET